jgi:hypothetical protein
MAVRGWATGCKLVAQGSEIVTAASIGATTLEVEWVGDFDDEGGTLLLNGTEIDYTTVDTDAETITLDAPLADAAAVGDRVDIVSGGQVAKDYTLFVAHGDGADAEIEIPFSDRDAWPEGDYDDPVEVILSDDLERIEQVVGISPVRRLINPFIATAEDGEPRIEITAGGSGGAGGMRFIGTDDVYLGAIYHNPGTDELLFYGSAGVTISIAAPNIELLGGVTMTGPKILGPMDANGQDVTDVADLDTASVTIGGGTKVELLKAGQGSVDTNGSGIGTFTHSLGISGTYWVQITSRDNANTRIFNITAKNTNNFQVRVDNDAGSPVASATGITFDYLILG